MCMSTIRISNLVTFFLSSDQLQDDWEIISKLAFKVFFVDFVLLHAIDISNIYINCEKEAYFALLKL